MTQQTMEARERVAQRKQMIADQFDDVYQLGGELEAFGRQLQDEVEFAEECDDADLEKIEAMLEELRERMRREISDQHRQFTAQLGDLEFAKNDLARHEEDED